MKSKNGFTLIELLAIIVILAIIAVITVPIILNIIEDSQKGAAKDSAYGFKDSVNKYYVSELAKDPHFCIKDGTYTVSELNGSAVLTGEETYTISLSGTVPTSGTIVIENNDIVGGNVQIGDYCIDLSNMNITKGECENTFVEATPEECGNTFAEATPEECFEYEDNGDNTVTITGYLCGGEFKGYNYDDEEVFFDPGEYMDVVIPSKIGEKKVKSIGSSVFSTYYFDGDYNVDAYGKKVVINSVIIPSSVTTIDESAFWRNTLTCVTIPNSVTTISAGAFSSNKLTSIMIPNSVTTIGSGAFSSNKLTSIMIPNSVTTIDSGAFSNNKLTSVTIPNSVTTVSNNSFSYNELTSVTIPNSVTTIGNGAFSYNELTSVIIPNGVTSIGDRAFYENQLVSATISNSVTYIGENAFFDNRLTSITIPNSVTTIGDAAFNKNNLPDNQAIIYARNDDGTIDTTTIVSYGGLNKNPVIPSGVTTIKGYSFYNDELVSVTIPSSVTTIGYSAFVFNPNHLIINVIGYASKPAGWANQWYYSGYGYNYTINWNYGG